MANLPIGMAALDLKTKKIKYVNDKLRMAMQTYNQTEADDCNRVIQLRKEGEF